MGPLYFVSDLPFLLDAGERCLQTQATEIQGRGTGPVKCQKEQVAQRVEKGKMDKRTSWQKVLK